MLSGYLGKARGDPRAQVSHLLQRRLSLCTTERERHRQRQLREEQEQEQEEAANDERQLRRRREQELLFLQRRQHRERLSDGEDDSFLRNYGRGRAEHLRGARLTLRP